MKKWVPTPDAIQLMLEASAAFAEVEAAGIRVDRDYLETAIADVSREIRETEEQIRRDPDYRLWQRRYGDKTNVGSPEQLAGLVFGAKGYSSKKKTAGGKREAADESAFAGIDLPIVKKYFHAQKLKKGRDTYLEGIRRELVRHDDGCWYVHPFFHQNTVASMRTSSSDPNWQNQPNRNPRLAEIIRRCYYPRPGHQLLEIDYGQIEVRIPCCYHSDPNLITYVCDPTKDMHRDVAQQLFFLGAKEVSKAARHLAKNQTVFPLFYGSYYAQTAPAVWEGLTLQKLKVEGTDASILDRLAENGIHELGDVEDPDPPPGTFLRHMKDVQEDFWGNRFKVYAQWKRDWVDAYHRDGGCQFLTGFVMYGPHKRNDITNYCIQGVAGHCKVWSMVRIVRWLRRYKMKTRVIGEIHDCINFDAHPRERDDVLYHSVRIMTETIKEWATWLNVPLTVECEACPVDASWFDKAVVVDKGGAWVPAKADDWENKYGPWTKQVVV